MRLRFLTIALMITFAAFFDACMSAHSGSLQYLDQYVGKEPAVVGLWETEPLHTQLKELMGDKYDPFIKDMKGGGPLTRDQYIYSLAYITQDSSRGYAFLLVDTKSNKIQAAIMTNKEIEKFQSPGEVFVVPAAIQNKLDSL